MQPDTMNIEAPAAAVARRVGTQLRSECDECLGSGGWYRYEPALDPEPGRLYLSCLTCRGTGILGTLRRA
jgi:hypothetical protein